MRTTSTSSFAQNLLGMQSELHRFAMKLTADKEEADDLLQETSLKALDNEDKYTPDTNFKGWMYTIMRNIFIPLSVPALATITLYYAVYFWNDWFNALIYLKSEQYPVMMILRNLVNGTMQMDSGNTATERSTVSIALKSAVIITSSVPIVVLYPFLSKYFVKGLTIGGVKG